ncbi:hypothetical protein FQN55_001402 [Onygenales sp. PD_40]|nr:hypothetical protein FQN55_001402 [Onygenales sp. PD_40]KAK2790953.1 hypothetical protein FQN51_002414 [Onygenales sp. PD_10]
MRLCRRGPDESTSTAGRTATRREFPSSAARAICVRWLRNPRDSCAIVCRPPDPDAHLSRTTGGSEWMAPAVVSSDDPRGKKRPAADELERDSDQRLTKRFGLLHIGQQHPSPIQNAPSKPAQKPPPSPNDAMQVDDTKHRVYIHDLDSELAEIEAQENNVAFLPEIEKRLMAVPKSVLTNKPPANNELVLYHVPSSLSLPETQDSVRRAIIEARERAREKKAVEVEAATLTAAETKHARNGLSSTTPPTDTLDNTPAYGADVDAMDIDDDS